MTAILRKPIIWIAMVALLLAGGGFSIMSAEAKARKATEARQAAAAAPSPYVAIGAGKADVEGGIIQVAARTAGVVQQVLVHEGDQVKKGQVLARLEDEQPRLAAQSAAAELQQARAQVELLKVQLATARREEARLLPLAPKSFVTKQALDQSHDAVRQAQANLDAQQAAIATAQAKLDEAKYNEELTVIRAPADGRIVRRYANPGAGASTLNVSNMFDLEPDAAHIVRAEITEGSLPFVAVGQPVQMSPEANPGQMFTGKVLREAPVFGARKLQSDDPAERTDERVVEVVVSADSAPFLIGQRVLVKFMRQQQAQARTVPRG
ncbi:efflux RND transporter periplasmic adaptor subunit [Phenylobacterium sp.]|uniref:efflux RND transporter periplasmic adaptor subunit n=1 Tax=Phenylobacterium sp. TaxID=1871053 RepID=UPI0026311657|nr:efflux RND transporter periplasmic adaptor subunit [Phenylobacterium sp.]